MEVLLPWKLVGFYMTWQGLDRVTVWFRRWYQTLVFGLVCDYILYDTGNDIRLWYSVFFMNIYTVWFRRWYQTLVYGLVCDYSNALLLRLKKFAQAFQWDWRKGSACLVMRRHCFSRLRATSTSPVNQSTRSQTKNEKATFRFKYKNNAGVSLWYSITDCLINKERISIVALFSSNSGMFTTIHSSGKAKCFSRQCQLPSHTAVSAKRFYRKEQMSAIEHCPYSAYVRLLYSWN